MAFLLESPVACPFFVPREMIGDPLWPHPARLPLGAGWRGSCCASMPEVIPDEETLRNFCNLGYARGCARLASDRDWDAIRFSVASSSAEQITLCFVCEANHAPREHGKLTYDVRHEAWLNPHPDPRVQRLAASYLETHRSRQDHVLLS